MSEAKSGKGGFLEFAKHEKSATNGVTPIGVSHDAKALPLSAVLPKADAKPEPSPVRPVTALRLDGKSSAK